MVSTDLWCVGAGGSSSNTRTGSSGGVALKTGLATDTAGSSSTNDSGLSAGAKAGIAAGVTVVGVLLLVFVTWFIVARRRQQRRGKQVAAAAAPPPVGPGMSAMSSPAAAASTGADYFAADGGAGSFTPGDAADASGLAPYSSNRAVPLKPHGPGDITVPVEIAASSAPPPDRKPRAGDGHDAHLEESDPSDGGVVHGRVELQ